jgi:hypothetical protein
MRKKMTKKKKSFPDVSGDGKVTKKDILMARGVIPKKKMAKKKKVKISYVENKEKLWIKKINLFQSLK